MKASYVCIIFCVLVVGTVSLADQGVSKPSLASLGFKTDPFHGKEYLDVEDVMKLILDGMDSAEDQNAGTAHAEEGPVLMNALQMDEEFYEDQASNGRPNFQARRGRWENNDRNQPSLERQPMYQRRPRGRFANHQRGRRMGGNYKNILDDQNGGAERIEYEHGYQDGYEDAVKDATTRHNNVAQRNVRRNVRVQERLPLRRRPNANNRGAHYVPRNQNRVQQRQARAVRPRAVNRAVDESLVEVNEKTTDDKKAAPKEPSAAEMFAELKKEIQEQGKNLRKQLGGAEQHLESEVAEIRDKVIHDEAVAATNADADKPAPKDKADKPAPKDKADKAAPKPSMIERVKAVPSSKAKAHKDAKAKDGKEPAATATPAAAGSDSERPAHKNSKSGHHQKSKTDVLADDQRILAEMKKNA